jgi:hypothetical protein
LIASAVGAGAAVVPLYLFGFRQIIDAKTALNERLQEQIKWLERERAATVIAEKVILVEEIERRAKEKQESDKIIANMTVQAEQIIEQLKRSAGGIDSLSAKVREATAEVKNRIGRDQVVGMLVAYQRFMELFFEWREISNEGSGDFTRRFDARFASVLGSLSELLRRVGKEGKLLELADIQAQERTVIFREQLDSASKQLNAN